MKSYYDTLEVSSDASREEIQAAFRKLAKKYHPDSNSAHASSARFQEVQEAYEFLNDPVKRRKYDLDGTVLHQIDIFQSLNRARDAALKKAGEFEYSGRRSAYNANTNLGSKVTKTSYSGVTQQTSVWSQAKQKVSSLFRSIGSLN